MVKSRKQELPIAGHITFTIRKQRAMNDLIFFSLSLLSPFHIVQERIIPLTVRMSLPTSNYTVLYGQARDDNIVITPTMGIFN